MKKVKKYVIMKIDKEDGKKYFVSIEDNNYTNNINDAFVYYSKKDARYEVSERGEKIVEINTKHTLIKKESKNAI